uniref:vitamin K epoxide reductase family protein n=1 Tax=Fulvivirga sp. TaxID=1931237 RepID=UPI00404B0E7E
DGTLLIIDENHARRYLPAYWQGYLGVAVAGTTATAYTYMAFGTLATVYMVLVLCGLLLAYLIVQQAYGIESKLADSVCGFVGKPTNCKQLITGKDQRLFGVVGYTDAVVVYFSTLLVMMVRGYDPTPGLVLGLISLPVVFYSLVVQYRKKIVCGLCMATIAVLVAQLAVSGVAFTTFTMDWWQAIWMGTWAVVLWIVWQAVAARLSQHAEVQKQVEKFARFKKDGQCTIPYFEKLYL